MALVENFYIYTRIKKKHINKMKNKSNIFLSRYESWFNARFSFFVFFIFARRILHIQQNESLLTSRGSKVSCHRGRPCKNGKMKEIGISPKGKFRKNTHANIVCKHIVFLLPCVEFPYSFGANLENWNCESS